MYIAHGHCRPIRLREFLWLARKKFTIVRLLRIFHQAFENGLRLSLLDHGEETDEGDENTVQPPPRTVEDLNPVKSGGNGSSSGTHRRAAATAQALASRRLLSIPCMKQVCFRMGLLTSSKNKTNRNPPEENNTITNSTTSSRTEAKLQQQQQQLAAVGSHSLSPMADANFESAYARIMIGEISHPYVLVISS